MGAQVVEEDGGLALPHVQPGQRLELIGVERAPRDRDLEPGPLAARLRRLEAHLVHREAELVEPTHPGLDLVTASSSPITSSSCRTAQSFS